MLKNFVGAELVIILSWFIATSFTLHLIKFLGNFTFNITLNIYF